MTRTLRPGEVIPLDTLGAAATAAVTVGLTVTAGDLPDTVALLVGESGKVRSDDDLVFYNNPTSADRAVTYLGQNDRAEWIRIAPPSVDADVARVVLGCAGGLLDTGTGGQLTVSVLDSAGRAVASATFDTDPALRAVMLLEVYRRAGQWRCRLLAQGFNGGLAALITGFGVQVDEQPPAPAPQPVTPPQTQPPQPTPADRPPTGPSNPYVPPPVVGHPPAPAWTSPDPAPAPHPIQGYGPPAGYHQQPSPSPYPAPAPADAGRRGGLFTSRKRAQLEAQNVELNRLLATSGALDNAAIAAERDRLAREVAAMAAEAERRRADLAGLESRLQQVRAAIATAEGDAELVEVGIYRFRHRLDDAVAYKGALDSLRDRIKSTARAGQAVTGNTGWTVNGSVAQGRKMVTEVSKLMLRAYNADADHAVRTMRAYKLDTALDRLDTTRNTIAKLGATMNIRVSDEYHRLRRDELALTADYLAKTEQEKEAIRAERERQREQQREEAEFLRRQERLDDERARTVKAAEQMAARGDQAAAAELRAKVAEIDRSLADLAAWRENRRLGHVYVISNVGAFGQRMVKIGMTRRQNPEDRIRELGDASVPFRFDKHALIFSRDAVELETRLHRRFADQRVNKVNAHREFFYVTPREVRDALLELQGELGQQFVVHFNEEIDAPEWRQSGGPERALLPTTA